MASSKTNKNTIEHPFQDTMKTPLQLPQEVNYNLVGHFSALPLIRIFWGPIT